MKQEIIFEKDTKKLYQIAAEIISRSITGLLEKQDTIVLGVPGGRSVAGVFEKLKDQALPWQRVHIFMVDERLVPLHSPESNFRIVNQSLLFPLRKKGRLTGENIHPFVVDRTERDFGVSGYSDLLARHGGIYHVVLLSMGEDGHIASLFPNHSVIKQSSGHLLVHDSPKPPSSRMTASQNLLLKSSIAILLCVGKEKQEAYHKFLDPEVHLFECPAKIVAEMPEFHVISNIM